MRSHEESAEARLSKRAIGVAAWRDSPDDRGSRRIEQSSAQG